jgi:type VI secretion system secreted protein Hcp
MAFVFYLKVHGNVQGDFKEETTNPRRIGWIECVDFQLDVASPIDQATGHASGKRQWKPIVIVKHCGAASPQFLQALVTGEVVSTVNLEFESVLPDGKEGTDYTVQLTNAAVIEVHQYLGSRHSEPTETHELERIQFTFQRITIESTLGKTMFTDDWQA